MTVSLLAATSTPACCHPQPAPQILVVVPEPDVREIVLAGLEMTTDWQAIAASSEAEGLRIAIAAQPQAIALDQADGGMEPCLLAQLAAIPETRHIPVILMVERLRLADMQHYQALGLAGVIAKPFDAVQLSQQMSHFLGWPLSV